jgi:predicted Zn-dependent peptidase
MWLTLLGAALAVETAPSIPYEHYELPNGLDVFLSEDHSVPFTWVNLWYDVGSKDELPGRSGFAHLYEHLMFEGSQHHDDEYFQPLQQVGAQINGTTNLDRTNYFEGVPSHQLPLALFLEADRMGYLLPALDEKKLQNQKDVVRNERRQRYENAPYGEAWPTLLANMYPAGHPYHIATIGRHEDLVAATLEDVKAFYRAWYAPSNAALTICGDFDPAEVKALVEKYFAPLPRGPEVKHAVATAASLDGEKRVTITDDVPFPKVFVAWHSPALYQAGDADLDLLSSVLAGGKDAPLYRALVRDKQIAQDVSAYQASNKLQSMYVIEATAAAGHTADELVAEIDRVLAEVQKAGVPAADLAAAQTEYLVQFYGQLATIQAKANLLNGYFLQTGDAGYLAKDLARYQGASADSVSAAMRSTLIAGRRVVLVVNPEAKP